jgi:biotin transport system ATP-binding protein
MEALFSIRGVSKVFPNGTRALDHVSLDIFEGECLLIAGSNGSGKTVLMRLLCGLSELSEGSILFRGIPLNSAKENVSLHQSLGMVFQDADSQLIGETVAEDVAFGPENLRLSKAEVEARTSAALNATGLTLKQDQPPRRLSGGEKRRLAIAGVLAMGCDTLIMDEPFANLDWPGVVQVLEIIQQMKGGGKTLIILTHELEKVLAFADRLVILDKGIIREDGASEDVLNRLDPAYGVRDPRRSCLSVADCRWL